MQQIHEALLVAAGKRELFGLETPELNAEAPPHLLDDDLTPVSRLFVRNSGRMPELAAAAAANWSLTIDGCVRGSRTWSVNDLKTEFEAVDQIAVLECAGNGRAFFRDPAGTVLWRYGAVGCACWTGARLADLIQVCGALPHAVYTGHHSPDLDLEGNGPALSRGIPLEKALAPETLVVYAVNGEPLPLLHGGPLRLLVPGYPGSASQKWLTRISLRDREHDGERMTDQHYRLPRTPIRYGEPFDHVRFDIITDMPVRSLITFPTDNFRASPAEALSVRGHTWSGHVPVARVDISADGGNTWHIAELGPLPDRFAWRRFEIALTLPRGTVELMSRATDTQGRTQPLDSAPWNPRGYCNNRVHRISGVIA